MDNKTKQQVFDVLTDIEELANEFELYWVPQSQIIPDNIETLMLDWLEEQGYNVKFMLEAGHIMLSSSRGGLETKCFIYRTESRQVALAESVVWVYKQQESKCDTGINSSLCSCGHCRYKQESK